jgi:8-oxo-dGTP pyrophosphatase MutT (NUDIX family)
MKNIQCTNCAEIGHILRDCIHPITSFGIIVYKIFYNKEQEDKFANTQKLSILENLKTPPGLEYPKIKMLLIQRKDTIGYTDFVRGKYKQSIIGAYFSEMTKDEQITLTTETFENIWDSLWINHRSKTYKNEYEYAKRKFTTRDIGELVKRYPSNYSFQEFGFPKGRRNIRELDIDCAIREFDEETSYKQSDYHLTGETLVEDFKGTDNIRYKHIYYLAELSDNAYPPIFDINNKYQVEEIKSIGFYTLEETMLLIREYDTEKRKVAILAHNLVLEKLSANEFII